MSTTEKGRSRTLNMVYAGLCVALITICSWITLPLTVPFTLQTFAVFLTIGLLGGKLGTLAVTAYILIGAAGVPVFAGFKGGIGALMGQTGGYIIGFLLTALFMWSVERFYRKKGVLFIAAMFAGLIICYAFGTAWFMFLYIRNTGAVSLITVLGWCVIPFIIPDCIKIMLAYIITKRLKKPFYNL